VGVAGVTWPNFQILGPLNNCWTNWAIHFKFGKEMEHGPLLRVDHKWPLSGRGLGHLTQFRNLGTPYNFWTNRAIRFKFGTDIEDGPLRGPPTAEGHLPWPVRRCGTLPDNLRDPAVGSDRFRRSLKTFLFATYWDMQRIRGSTRMRYTNLLLLTYYLLIGRGLGQVTQFRNFGTLL